MVYLGYGLTLQVFVSRLYKISYSDDQLSFYLSSLIASCEYSSRGVCITSLIIKSNPANYTAWAYRMDCAERLELPLADEMGIRAFLIVTML